jgi:1-acyl-sn-glycerol-3-phosphate acyltransferase
MHETALHELSTDPSSAFANQMFNGIPVKVYAHIAGQLGMDFAEIFSAMLPRLARIGIVGGIGWVGGGLLSRYLKPCLGAVQAVCLTVFPLGLGLIIWWWS